MGDLHYIDDDGVEKIVVNQSDVDDTPVDGVLIAPISSNWAFDHEAKIAAILAALNEPTGFPNRTDSVLSFSTRTLTINPVGASFDIFQASVKTTISTSDAAGTNTITIPSMTTFGLIK